MRKSTETRLVNEIQRGMSFYVKEAAETAQRRLIEDLGMALAEIIPPPAVKREFGLMASTCSVRYPSPEARAFVNALVTAVESKLTKTKKNSGSRS